MPRAPFKCELPGRAWEDLRFPADSWWPGNSHLKGALGIAAMAAVRTNGTYLQARYKRLTSRRGPMRALVAIEHTMIIAIWHMFTNGTVFEDLGSDHFQRTHRKQSERKAIKQLHQLGYEVQLTPLTAAS